MKKSNLFFITFISLSIVSGIQANAEEKKAPKVNMSGALGKNLNVDGPPSTPTPGTSNNIFYNATVGKKAPEAPKPTPTPVPTPPPEGGTGMINPAILQKNQTKENYISNGMRLLDEENLDGAMSEFRRAQSIYDDKLIQRWIKVVENRKKVAQVNKILSDMGEKSINR